MPRPFTERIIDTEAATPQRAPAALDINAAPTNPMVQQGPNEFQQLADALGQVHAPLAAIQQRRDIAAEKRAQQEGLAAAAREQNVGLIKDNPDPPPTSVVPPAFSNTYAEAYKRGVGQRLAQQEHSAYLDKFAEEYQKPGFDKSTFDAQYRQQALAGITDPILTAETMAGLDRAMQGADSTWTIHKEKVRIEARSQALAAGLDAIDENTPVPAQMALYQKLAQTHVDQGGTRVEAAKALFDHMAGLSMKLGGRPDLFDVFDQPVPGVGQKLVDLMGQGAKDQIFSERHQAEEMAKRTTNEHNMAERGATLARLETEATDGTLSKMDPEERVRYLAQHTGPTGALNQHSMAELLMKVQAADAARADQAYVQYALNNHMGALLTPEQAKKGMAARFNTPLPQLGGQTVMGALGAALSNPQVGAQTLGPLATAILNQHDTAGLGFPDESIKRIIDATVMDIPKDGGTASPQFKFASELYAQLGRTNKALQAAYFEGKAGQIFETYNNLAVNGQADPETARKQAYASTDPEAQRAAKEMLKDPAFRADISSTASGAMKSLFGSGGTAGRWRFMLPGGELLGFKPDTGYLEQSARDEALAFKTANPHASQRDVENHIEQWTQANFFYEKNSNTMVRIPPAFNNQAGQESLSQYLGIVSQNNPDMHPRLLSKGNGTYGLYFYPNGSAVGTLIADDVHIEQMMALRSATTNFTEEERKTFASIRNKLDAGTATADDFRANDALITKARNTGVWTPEQQRKADALQVQAAQEKSMTQLQPALQTAAHRAEFKPSVIAKPNGTLTAPIAQQFAQSGDLAGALTTMGEGVRTVAYKDSGGHTTIGIGYNMDANAKTLPDDFRRAGIPVEQIDEIKAGTRQITTDQAMRLYQAVQPRYEAIARQAVQTRYPGEWDKLSDNVRAVLTDLAYQTGNVKQFGVGLDNLFKGDLSGNGIEVKFKNSNTGQYQTDVRRHTLRTAMLSSTNLFSTLLNDAAKQPANAVQSRLARAGTP